MQVIYNYITETNYISRVHNFAHLSALKYVLISVYFRSTSNPVENIGSCACL
jgi:hypothetical protein